MDVVEEPRNAALLGGQDDGLVRVEAALSAICQEAVKDHGVPGTRRYVEAVLSERTPRPGGEFVDLASQGRDAAWAYVRSGKGGVEAHDPRRLRGDDLGERVSVRSKECAVEVLDEVSEPLLVHADHSLGRRVA